MLLKKSPYYTLEIGVLDIKITYENISRKYIKHCITKYLCQSLPSEFVSAA